MGDNAEEYKTYQILARLEAQGAVLVDGVKDIRTHLERLNGKTDKAHKRIDNLEHEVSNSSELLKKTTEVVEKLDLTKKKLYWTVGGISLGGAVAGSKLGAILMSLLH